MPTNQERQPSDSPSLSATGRLIGTVPLTEKPAAATRLDDIIHQSTSPHEPSTTTTPYYNVTDDRHTTERKSQRSSSSSSSSTTSSSSIGTARQPLPTTTTELPARNLNRHQSLESIPRRTSQSERPLDPTNKTTSLEFGQRPATRYNDPGSIYITPQEATHPASQYQNAAKGWIRKQNRGKFSLRIQRHPRNLSLIIN